MKRVTYYCFAILGIALMSSCVSMKKYKRLEASLADLQYNAQSESQIYKHDRDALNAKIKELEATKQNQLADYNDLKSKYDALSLDRDDVLNRYDALLEQNKNVLNTASSEKEELSAQLIKQQKELESKQNQLKTLEKQLKDRESDLANTTAELEGREKKINELQTIIDTQNKKVADLKTKLTNALKGFSATDLSVKEQNGKVYVSLSQNLLFATGSDKLDPKGISAIKQLAAVLAANTDIDILVEGHTDNTGSADLNWDLSTNRANAVSKVLTANKIDGKRITSSGRGMFMPVASNADATGKAQNRRTDIILSPKLDELYKLLSE